MEPNVTRLLNLMAEGDVSAGNQLFDVVYADLRQRAAQLMRSPSGHTLQPTAVVNEAWIRLSSGREDFEGRQHFLGVAAKAMRSVLVDHARAKKTIKRGREFERVELDDAVEAFEERSGSLVALDDALMKLQGLDPELARLVELRFFGGRTIVETAEILGVSTPTVERGWRMARSWLRTEMGAGDEDHPG